MSKDAILNALSSLSADDDTHWTSDGLPLLDNLKQLTGIASLTRSDVTSALPGFSRNTTAMAKLVKPVQEVKQEPTPRQAADNTVDGLVVNEQSVAVAMDHNVVTDLQVAQVQLDEARVNFNAAKREYEAAQLRYDVALLADEEANAETNKNAPILDYLTAQEAKFEARARAVIASRG